MRNALIKNNKTGVFRDLQHRTSHYNKILNAKSPISEQYRRLSFKSHFSNLNCKKAHLDQRDRIKQNHRLITSLIDIEKNYNIYGKSKTKENRKLAKSLKNQFQQNSKLIKISIDNFQLFKRINNSTSEIGSSSSWRKRQKYNKKLHGLLKSPIQVAVQIDKEYYQTFSKLRRKKKQKKISYEDILRKRSLEANSSKWFDLDNSKQLAGPEILSKNSQEIDINTPSSRKKKSRRKIYSKVRYTQENQVQQHTTQIKIEQK